MMEKNVATHDTLKQLAKKILLSKGFSETEIFMEYPVIVAGAKMNLPFDDIDMQGPTIRAKKSVIADVIGIKDNYAVVIECGMTPADRLAQFNLIFDEVLLLPFVETVKDLEEKESMAKQIERLTEEKRALEKQNSDQREKLEKVRESLS